VTEPLHPDAVSELVEHNTIGLSEPLLTAIEKAEIAVAGANGALHRVRSALEEASSAFSEFGVAWDKINDA
jgi:hypothetical protein